MSTSMDLNARIDNSTCKLIYSSSANQSITSLSESIQAKTKVYYDASIAHLMTQAVVDNGSYYDISYRVDIQQEERDSLYGIVDNKKIYRTEHQLNIFMQKVKPVSGMRVLDYGCAKGLFVKKLFQKCSIEPYLFDITDGYSTLWEKNFDPEHCATYTLEKSWQGQMDIVSSFYVFEHVIDPVAELSKIYDVLKDDGLLYLQVPNVYEHVADFICVDHLHHYSPISLTFLLHSCGFEVIDIDASSYSGALIVLGKKTTHVATVSFSVNDYEHYQSKALQMAQSWQSMEARIAHFYRQHMHKKALVYGAGFYGIFILSHLPKSHNVAYIVDQNDFLHGSKVDGLEVKAVHDIGDDIEVVYIGLNPLYAKTVIENLDVMKRRVREYFFWEVL